jgi:hypothetical protein
MPRLKFCAKCHLDSTNVILLAMCSVGAGRGVAYRTQPFRLGCHFVSNVVRRSTEGRIFHNSLKQSEPFKKFLGQLVCVSHPLRKKFNSRQWECCMILVLVIKAWEQCNAQWGTHWGRGGIMQTCWPWTTSGTEMERLYKREGRVIKSLKKNLPEFIQNTFSLLKTVLLLWKNLILCYTVPLLCSKMYFDCDRI